MHPRVRSILTVAAALLLAASVAGSWGAWHRLLDLASHFRWYWLLAAAAGCVILARRPRSVAFACCGLALVGNAWAMLPFWLPPAGLPEAVARAPDAGAPLELVVVNLLRSNADKTRAVSYLRDRAADLVVILEVDADWMAHLSSLDEAYPHRIVETRDDNFGIALLSRWPIADGRIVTFGGTPFPNIDATVRFQGRPVRLFATHPHPPFDADDAVAQMAQLGALAAAAAAAPPPCIVAGDFNATPWSVPYRSFAARSGLRDTALGRGVQATWNARRVAPRIPIDHVFVSPDVAVLRRTVGPDVGSDHFPVEATLVLPPPD